MSGYLMTVIDWMTTSTVAPPLSFSVNVIVPEPSLSPWINHDTLELPPGATDPTDCVGFCGSSNCSISPGDHVTVTVNPVAVAPPVLVTVSVAVNSSPRLMLAGTPLTERLSSGAGGAELSTVTLTAAEVPVFPAASDATAVRLCAPSAAVVVSHDALYGAVVSVLNNNTPSTKN